MKNKLLLIVDPQVDFITGTLPVPDAKRAMDSLSDYLRRHGSDYVQIIVTADRHPMCHCSFRSEGGEWPVHCVADSVGAAIWPAIMERLLDTPDKVTILHKGEEASVEEYSILKNTAAAERIRSIIKEKNIGHTDICGLAGDVCVAATIDDWANFAGKTELHVLKDYTPTIASGLT